MVYFRNIIVVERGRIRLSWEDVLPWDLFTKTWPRNDEGRGQGVGCKGVGLERSDVFINKGAEWSKNTPMVSWMLSSTCDILNSPVFLVTIRGWACSLHAGRRAREEERTWRL